MLVKLIVPTGVLLETTARSVSMNGEEGVFEVLPKHTNLFANLRAGIVKVSTEKGQELKYFIDGGVAQISGKQINIITEFGADLSKTDKAYLLQSISDDKAAILKECEPIEIIVIQKKLERHEQLLKYINEK